MGYATTGRSVIVLIGVVRGATDGSDARSMLLSWTSSSASSPADTSTRGRTTLRTGVPGRRPSGSRPWRYCDNASMGGRMRLDRDFSEFIALLCDHDVRFLVVGGYAVAAHGHPRYTGDLDVWVLADPDNSARLLRALDDFGFGSVGLTTADFLTLDQVVQLGYPPLWIDLLTSVDGVSFDECYPRRIEFRVDDVTVPFIGLDDLRRNKAASARPQDVADLDALDS